jgi:hypothetical protein
MLDVICDREAPPAIANNIPDDLQRNADAL